MYYGFSSISHRPASIQRTWTKSYTSLSTISITLAHFPTRPFLVIVPTIVALAWGAAFAREEQHHAQLFFCPGLLLLLPSETGTHTSPSPPPPLLLLFCTKKKASVVERRPRRTRLDGLRHLGRKKKSKTCKKGMQRQQRRRRRRVEEVRISATSILGREGRRGFMGEMCSLGMEKAWRFYRGSDAFDAPNNPIQETLLSQTFPYSVPNIGDALWFVF